MRRVRIYDRFFRLLGYIPMDDVPTVRIEDSREDGVFIDVRLPHGGVRYAGRLERRVINWPPIDWSDIVKGAAALDPFLRDVPESLGDNGPSWRDLGKPRDVEVTIGDPEPPAQA